MKRALTIFAALVTAGAAIAAKPPVMPKDLPPYGQDKPLPTPQVIESRLPNGLTVWVVQRPGFPKVTAMLTVRGGSASDPQDLAGLSEVLTEALKGGTKTRSAQRIAQELQAVGAELSVNSSKDATFVALDGISTGLPTMLKVLADVVQNATFPVQEVELARANALQGLKAAESTPEFAVDKAFNAAVYGAHPYGVISGTAASYSAMTRDVLVREWQRRFRPEQALLLVVGAADPRQVNVAIVKELGTWKGVGEGVSPTAAPPALGPTKILAVERPGSVQSEIRVGRPMPGPADPDYFPVQVANTIFGGAFSSRLVENIREDKGYTYSPRIGVSPSEKGSLLRVRAAVRNEVTGGALLEIFYELDRMGATLPTADELARAKRFLSGIFTLQNQTQGAVAGTLARYWVFGLPPAALGEYVPKVNAVTAEKVREAGNKYFTSRSQTVVIGGDVAKIQAEITPFGKVEKAP